MVARSTTELASTTVASTLTTDVVVVRMTIGSVEFSALQADASMMQATRRAVACPVASAATTATGTTVSCEDVSVELQSGSVIADATIVMPDTSNDADGLAWRLQLGTSLATTVAQQVSDVPGIEAASNGAIVVSEISASAQVRTRARGSSSDSATTSAGAPAVPSESVRARNDVLAATNAAVPARPWRYLIATALVLAHIIAAQ